MLEYLWLEAGRERLPGMCVGAGVGGQLLGGAQEGVGLPQRQQHLQRTAITEKAPTTRAC